MNALIIESRVPLATLDQTDPASLVEFSPVATLDVQQNAFFLEELKWVIPEMVLVEPGEIVHRDALPVDRRGGPGATTIEFRQQTMVGGAKVVSDYGGDFPKAAVFGEAFTSKVVSLGAEASWTLQEIRSQALANQNSRGATGAIDRETTEAAKQSMLELENSLTWAGSTKFGLTGMFSTGNNIPVTVVPTGGGGDEEWSLKTAQEIVDDLNFLVNEIVANSLNKERPDTILLPLAQFQIAINKNMGLGTDTTVLSYFAANSPYIDIANIHAVDDLKGAGAGGDDVGIAFKKDISKFALHIPLDMESLAPEKHRMMTTVMYHSRFGGVTIKKPISLNIIQRI